MAAIGSAWFELNEKVSSYLYDNAVFDVALFADTMRDTYEYFKKLLELPERYKSYPIEAVEILLQMQDFAANRNKYENTLFVAAQYAVKMLIYGAIYFDYMPSNGRFADDFGFVSYGGRKFTYNVYDADLKDLCDLATLLYNC